MAMQNGTKRIPLGLALAVAVTLLHQDATATIGPIIDLGTASSFAVLGGSGIANAGTTTINGDVGTFPTATMGGFGTVTLNGTNYGGGPFTQNAKIDLNTAYTNAVGISPTAIYDPIFDLGGLILTPGVYNDSSSFGITGTLTLDAQGDPNAVWIFQAGSTLITTANSMITLTNGAQASNVFWQVGSSATLGMDSAFSGNILAYTSITLDTGVVDHGQALALNGAVSFNNDTVGIIAAPEPGSMMILGCGLATLVVFRRRLA